MSTTTMLLIAGGSIVIVALVVIMLRRSWGSSMNEVGRLRLDVPPAPLPDGTALPEYERTTIAELLARGQKIEAIKRYRTLTGVGLKEAKDAVEAWERAGSAPDIPTATPSPAPGGDIAEVHALARSGKKIEAIKRYRELTGVGLKEAKDAVERMEAGN